jgi:phosphohistidine phosphatase
VIWFLRHGDAEDDAIDDASRRLTKKGRRQSRDAGRALAALGIELDACISSPKTRAADTARIACEELGLEVEIDERLRGGDFNPADLAVGRGEVLLVGHEPDFSRAVGTLTGGRVELKKGGVAAVEGSELVALLRPPQLRLMAGD